MMTKWVILFVSFFVLASGSLIEPPLRVAAWNIQKLGQTKMSKPEVVEAIVQIMKLYDLIAILEIQDSQEIVPRKLLEAVNRQEEFPFELVLSERLGRTSYKEQYGFYYRPSKLTLQESFQYNDSKDLFQVEPFAAVFKGGALSSPVAFLAIHTKPDDAAKEIDALKDVYDSIVQETKISDVVIFGDFNAGCDYVVGDDWSKIRLFTDKNFKWLIDNHADTTTKSTTCPYDRIVVRGSQILDTIIKGSATPYYFDENLEFFRNYSEAELEAVSDHYPVQFKIQGMVDSKIYQAVSSIYKGIRVDYYRNSSTMSEKNTLRSTFCKIFQLCFQDMQESTAGGYDFNEDKEKIKEDISLRTPDIPSMISALRNLVNEFPELIRNEVVDVVEYKLLYEDLVPDKSVLCTIQCPHSFEELCSISVAGIIKFP